MTVLKWLGSEIVKSVTNQIAPIQVDYYDTNTGGFYWQGQTWFQCPQQPQMIYFYPSVWKIPTEPKDCSGDLHIFPYPHCQSCKCGKAKLTKGKL